MIAQAEVEELRGEVRSAEERVKRMRDAVSGAESDVAMSVAHLEGGLRRSEAVLGVLATQVRNVAAGRQHAEAEREQTRRGFGETLKAHNAEVNALRRDIRLREEEKASLMTTIRSLEGAVERGVEARAELEETIRGMEEEQR
jgi:chromosome segregation ATPase